MKKLLPSLAVFVLLPACEQGGVKPDNGDDKFRNDLLEVLVSIEQQSYKFSQASSNVRVKDESYLFKNLPKKLTEVYNVQWNGSPEKLLESLSTYVGFEFYVDSNNPSKPIDVSINESKTPLVEILEKIGLQLSSPTLVEVVVDESTNDFVVKLDWEAK